MRRIDDELNAIALDEIDDVRTSFFHLVDAFDLQADIFQHACGTVSGDQAEAQVNELAAQIGDEGLVAIVGADEDAS